MHPIPKSDFMPVFEVPRHSAPVTEFVKRPGLERDAAVAWARGVLADVAHYSDFAIIRACKLIEANDKAFYITAHEMRRFLERCEAERQMEAARDL